jgi:hypothetical protein
MSIHKDPGPSGHNSPGGSPELPPVVLVDVAAQRIEGVLPSVPSAAQTDVGQKDKKREDISVEQRSSHTTLESHDKALLSVLAEQAGIPSEAAPQVGSRESARALAAPASREREWAQLERVRKGAQSAVSIDNKSSEPLHRRLLNPYFEPKSFEANGTIYRMAGVHIFKAVLIGGATGFFKVRSIEHTKKLCPYFLGGHSLTDLKKTEGWTRIYESMHVAAILFTNLPHVTNTQVLPFMLTAFAVNLYCVLLQRYNRERLHRAIQRIESRPSQRMPRFWSTKKDPQASAADKN